MESRTNSKRFAHAISVRNISAVYVLALLVVAFCLMLPDTFATSSNLRSLLTDQAVVTVVAVGLTIAMAAGLFDLSVGATSSLTSVFVAQFMTGGHGTFTSVLMALGLGLAIGFVNGLLVVWVRIDSFITTLAMSSILISMAVAISDQQIIIGLPKGFSEFGSAQAWGMTWIVWIMLALAIVCWCVMEQTPAGRYLYAIGSNLEAAKLAGIPTGALRIAALTACSGMSALAGVLLTAQVSGGSADAGTGYLLPAFAAVFLGTTQFQSGLPNVWGTVVGVFTLAVGVNGLQLLGAPFWIADLFNGLALIVAVGLTRLDIVQGVNRALRRRTRRGGTGSEGASTPPGSRSMPPGVNPTSSQPRPGEAELSTKEPTPRSGDASYST